MGGWGSLGRTTGAADVRQPWANRQKKGRDNRSNSRLGARAAAGQETPRPRQRPRVGRPRTPRVGVPGQRGRPAGATPRRRDTQQPAHEIATPPPVDPLAAAVHANATRVRVQQPHKAPTTPTASTPQRGQTGCQQRALPPPPTHTRIKLWTKTKTKTAASSSATTTTHRYRQGQNETTPKKKPPPRLADQGPRPPRQPRQPAAQKQTRGRRPPVCSSPPHAPQSAATADHRWHHQPTKRHGRRPVAEPRMVEREPMTGCVGGAGARHRRRETEAASSGGVVAAHGRVASGGGMQRRAARASASAQSRCSRRRRGGGSAAERRGIRADCQYTYM